MTQTANGTFTIVMIPPPAGEGAGRLPVGRMFIDKQYSGDLIATGQGEMLSAGSPAAGSAGYVAIEHVTGALHGRSGSFALQHSGIMHNGESHLSISIVPGSGSGDFVGIEGKLKIDSTEGKHFYAIDYVLG